MSVYSFIGGFCSSTAAVVGLMMTFTQLPQSLTLENNGKDQSRDALFAAIPLENGATQLSVLFSEWGREQDLKTVETAQPAISEESGSTRLSYSYGPIQEWWQESDNGVQSGWDILKRPVGDGALQFISEPSAELKLASKLKLTQSGSFKATDRNGRELPTVLIWEGGELTLTIDDSFAFYPLVIQVEQQHAASKMASLN